MQTHSILTKLIPLPKSPPETAPKSPALVEGISLINFGPIAPGYHLIGHYALSTWGVMDRSGRLYFWDDQGHALGSMSDVFAFIRQRGRYQTRPLSPVRDGAK